MKSSTHLKTNSFNPFQNASYPEVSRNEQASKWYAIYTKSRFEKKINQALVKAGFQTFLPFVKEKRVWSDRLKTVQVPLIPSYVFIKIAKRQFPVVYNYPGFARFVSLGGKVCEIKEEEIELLKKFAAGDFKAQLSTSCRVGDWVRIVKGPLKGWEGRVDSTQGARIVFHLESIDQSLSVELCSSYIEQVSR